MESKKVDVYTKNIVEFVTVSVEYCAFLEHSNEKDAPIFVSVMQKLLPLLYMKTAMLDKPIPIGDDEMETFVTETDYEVIRKSIERLLGRKDAYFDGDSATSVSENMCDIYQDLKDFTLNYKKGNQTISNDALYACLENFENYWGLKLLNALKQIHELRSNPQIDDNDLSE